jgi:hypothetical protein
VPAGARAAGGAAGRARARSTLSHRRGRGRRPRHGAQRPATTGGHWRLTCVKLQACVQTPRRREQFVVAAREISRSGAATGKRHTLGRRATPLTTGGTRLRTATMMPQTAVSRLAPPAAAVHRQRMPRRQWQRRGGGVVADERARGRSAAARRPG